MDETSRERNIDFFIKVPVEEGGHDVHPVQREGLESDGSEEEAYGRKIKHR